MKMNNNRYYYKQGQSNKVPYLMVVIIIALLWIIKGMHEDVKDANKMFEKVIHEFPKNDSIGIYKQKIDSLNAVIDWYRKQDVFSKKTNFTPVKKTKVKEPAPVIEIKDSI